MRKKTGAQEHTIIIGTILASIVVFVLGFFLGRVWVLMPQEKMVKDKKEPTSMVIETETEEFEETFNQLKEQKLKEELKREQEAKEKVKRIMEEEKEREREEKLAILKERQEEERKKELEKRKKREELLAQEKKLSKIREEKQKKEKELAKKKEEELAKKKEEELKMLAKRKEEEQRRKLLEEQKRKQQKETQKALEAKRKAMVGEKPKPVEEKPTIPSTLTEGESYTLQLLSSTNKERVDELLTELRSRGYAAYASQVDLKEKGIWYRVRHGKYSTEEEARIDGETLKNKGIISQYWVTKR